MRRRVLKEEPICRRCGKAPSTIADHIIPRELGGTDDRSNYQGLCKPCHDAKTATEDGRWTGRPASRVIAVCGPPGAGKNRFIAQQFHAGDLIVDLDRIFIALSGLGQYDKPSAILPFAMSARDAVLERLAKPSTIGRAWIATGAPLPKDRDRLERVYRAQVLVFETPPEECLRHIESDPSRKDKVQLWAPIVGDWWSAYRRRDRGDTVMDAARVAA